MVIKFYCYFISRYYSEQWLGEDANRVAPHKDMEITKERKSCLLRYFANEDERRQVNIEFASFSMSMNEFGSGEVMKDRFLMPPITWWAVHGASALTLQALAFKLLGKPCSSSCCERNWSTYNFILFEKEQDNTTKSEKFWYLCIPIFAFYLGGARFTMKV